jgi:DNA-directed RNA polymerase sigma subunit (sigma70/sigma32)
VRGLGLGRQRSAAQHAPAVQASLQAAVADQVGLERRIVELRFGFDGEQRSLEAIERELGVSRERIRRIEQRAFAQLGAELKDVVEADQDELVDAA